MERSTQVVVVGAGPVGLFAAICLRDLGLDVAVVDRGDPREVHSYAVVLHPRVLAALSDVGVRETLLWQGQSFKRVVLHTDGERRAVLTLMPSSDLASGGLTLPQDVLRRALERALHERGVEVSYDRRFASLEQAERSVRVRLARFLGERAGASVGGDLVTVDASFVIGADGHGSSVRSVLGIDLVRRGSSETFAFFDVASSVDRGLDTEVVLDDASCAAKYRLHGEMTRYSFQLPNATRRPLDARALEELLGARVPFRTSELGSVEWSGTATFDRALVSRFGQGRVWLAGDAAHATSPLGTQSLNVGLYEARELARHLAECAKGAPLDRLGKQYDAARQDEWSRLLGFGGAMTVPKRTPEWLRRHLPRLIPCLPASGDDLDDLLDQLGLSVA